MWLFYLIYLIYLFVKFILWNIWQHCIPSWHYSVKCKGMKLCLLLFEFHASERKKYLNVNLTYAWGHWVWGSYHSLFQVFLYCSLLLHQWLCFVLLALRVQFIIDLFVILATRLFLNCKVNEVIIFISNSNPAYLLLFFLKQAIFV